VNEWVAVAERLPQPSQHVLILISDERVAITAYPTCAYIDLVFRGKPDQRVDWWAGVPGNYHRVTDDGWTVTHWKEIGDLPAENSFGKTRL
jgi:Protein of unknown function (DUF551)